MKSRWIFRVYNVLVLIALPFILLGVMLRWRKRFARGLERGSERWGHLTPETAAHLSSIRASGVRWWWVHAVSLGEVKSIEVFLRQIPRQAGVRVLLSAVTPEALLWAVENQLADEIIAAPIDLPWVVRRVFRAVQPQLFISVESEFWPNLLREARRCQARVALVNGRISAHSYESYKRVRFILPVLWDCFDLLSVRQHEDASRFIDLGVPQHLVHVTGNLKYDLPLPQRATGEPIHGQPRLTLVMGSTREGEEALLVPVMEKLRVRFPNLRVIVAPRHVDRVGEIEGFLRSSGLESSRKSTITTSPGLPAPLPAGGQALPDGRGTSEARGEGGTPYVLWDSMGDLLDAYKQADVAVIGGSFVAKGGQNPLEPAAMTVPVIFGPSMENFHGIAEVLVQQGGARQVTLSELEVSLGELLENPGKRQEMGRRARQAVESRQGASDKAIALLKGLVRA